MTRHVLVLGGSVAGLTCAIGLARRGHRVTVVERDVAPSTDSGDEAFLTWERPGVPQFRQPHGFSARARNLLKLHIPEVVERLRADGVEEHNIYKALAPPETWQPSDEDFTGLLTRRAAFELALRRVAEREPGVELLSPAALVELRCTRTDDGTLRVIGGALEDGRVIDADMFLDCGGRRSPVARWLAEHGVTVPSVEQDCGATYYTRHYRQHPDSGLPAMLLFALRGETGNLMFIGFPGDHRAFGVLLAAPPADEALRVLRHDWAWEAAARSIAPLAPWIDEANATPLTSVATMASHQNARRQFVVAGRPLVEGLLAVGDSLCTTNPAYGWGASMALTYAFAAVDAVAKYGGDMVGAALAYDEAVRDEADAVYRESAAMDRARLYRLTGQAVPAEDAEEWERQDIIQRGVAAGAFRDIVLGRALLRRTNLLDRPDGILDDPDVAQRAREVRDIMATKTPRKVGPTREELLTILAAAKSLASVGAPR